MTRDPWFRKGYKQIKFHEEDYGSGYELGFGCKGDGSEVLNLNAFDIISFSSGLDLSGLFGEFDGVERFVLRELPEKILEVVEEVGAAEGMALRWKKECGVELEGLSGKFGIEIEVYRLTAEVAMVEVRRRGSDVAAFCNLWDIKLKPQLLRGEATTSY
jgi:hypothetical protein